MAHRHEVTRKELVVLAADVDEAFPDDLVSIRIPSVCDQGKQLSTFRMLVYCTEVIVAEHDGE
jgi:hypothetical protein